MRLAAPLLAALLLAVAAPAQASWRDDCIGPYSYKEAGMPCSAIQHYRHPLWRVHAHLLYHRHPPRRAYAHLAYRLHPRWRAHAHLAWSRAAWVNVPLENRGGLCPEGDCGRLWGKQPPFWVVEPLSSG